MGLLLSRLRGGFAGAKRGAVMAFHTANSWNAHWESHQKQPNQPMVIDFSASWCGPCRFIEPAFKALAARFTGVVFAKLDVDELPEVAQKWGVEAMPTFVLLVGGREVDRVVGADKDELEAKIVEKLAPAPADAPAAAVAAPDADGGEEAPSAVVAFHNTDSWNSHWESHRTQPNQRMVIDFSASWCGPCRFIEPAYKALAAKFPDMVFAKIDVDELHDVAKKWKVQAMPTFVLVSGGREVARVVGAKKEELEANIVQKLTNA